MPTSRSRSRRWSPGSAGARSIEELDAAVDLARLLPDKGGDVVKEEHRDRRVALTST